MWLPQLLQTLNQKQMKALGMKITAADIYSINKASLKDAIVSFGGFCTAEVISNKGLLLTNHHCGFDAIQNHSTLSNNYIRDGFWAKNNGEEIPNPGLFATFIVRIDDVTTKALAGITIEMDERSRQSAIDKNITALRNEVKKEAYQDVTVRPFFEGNKYYAFVTETYKDVRLVGAPPSSIGNFGKDTDNWMWPRHTGDFSMFRIYAGPDGKPAEFSPNNKPYKPKRSLSISMAGVKKNDFTMVFGFPGRTMEYLPAVAVQQIVSSNDPAKIAIRDRALFIMDEAMRADEAVKIQYAAKYASVQNAYKKWQGEVLGITKTEAVKKKREYEAEFQKRVAADPAWSAAYGDVLTELTVAYGRYGVLGLNRDYYNEVVSRIEVFAVAAQLNRLQNAVDKNGEAGFAETLPLVKASLQSIYGEYNPAVDKRLFAGLMRLYVSGLPKAWRTNGLGLALNIRASISLSVTVSPNSLYCSPIITLVNSSCQRLLTICCVASCALAPWRFWMASTRRLKTSYSMSFPFISPRVLSLPPKIEPRPAKASIKRKPNRATPMATTATRAYLSLIF